MGLQSVRLPDAFRQTLRRNDKTAVIVLDVHLDGPADKAGMVIGDIVVSLGGQSITRLEDVQSLLAGDAIGKTLPLKFIRGGTVQDGNIVIAERPHGENKIWSPD